MNKLLTVVAAVAALGVALPALAASDAECQAMWTKADLNKDGKLTAAENQRYFAMMRVNDYKKLPADEAIDQASFLEACKADMFVAHKADAGAPLKGANSFTEGQARDRAMAHGFANVGKLNKDNDGIWRGQATADDGKPVEIAVDFKGNVVPATRQQ